MSDFARRLGRVLAAKIAEHPASGVLGPAYEFEGGLYLDVDGTLTLDGLAAAAVRAVLAEMRESSASGDFAANLGVDPDDLFDAFAREHRLEPEEQER